MNEGEACRGSTRTGLSSAMTRCVERVARWRWLETTVVFTLLATFVAACLSFAWKTSPVFDEPGFLRAGYANLQSGVAKSATGNLLFAPTWFSLPLLALHPTLPSEEEALAAEPETRELGRLFVFHPRNDWHALIHAARVMNIVLGVILAVMVWRWSRALFGPLGAAMSLTFFVLAPQLIANSAIATTDIAVTLWLLVALRSSWVLLHHVSVANLVKCSATLGLLFVTKVSGFIVVPVVAVLMILRIAFCRPLVVSLPGTPAREISGRMGQLIGLFAAQLMLVPMAAGVIWLCYLPTLTIFADPHAAWPWAEFARQSHGALGTMAERLHQWHLLPDSYLFDIRVFDSSASERRAYLLGDYSIRGWWYFFPIAWLFKTPLPFIAALAIAGGVGLARLAVERFAPRSISGTVGANAMRRPRLYEMTPLVIFVASYSAAAIVSRLNIGVRHILPIQPPLFILAGCGALLPLSRWRAVTLTSLLAWSAVEFGRTAPEFMAYCNSLAGGTANGHRALIDSSYEWGQDLPAVERWLETRAKLPGPKPPVFFSYFGNADLSRFKIEAVLLPQFFDLRPNQIYALHPGTYIISATMLHTLYGPAMGPWRPSYERSYQELTKEMRRLETLLPDSARVMELVRKEGESVWIEKFRLYDALRFARLCACLRQREPDARITAGMLVFELKFDELERALFGPPTEMREDFQIEGTKDLPQSRLTFLK